MAPECTLEAQDFRRNDTELIYTCYRPPYADVLGVDLATGKTTVYRKEPGEYNEVEGIFPDGEYTLVESSREQIEHNSNYIDIWKLKLEPEQPRLHPGHSLGRVPRLQGVEPGRQPRRPADRVPVGAQQGSGGRGLRHLHARGEVTDERRTMDRRDFLETAAVAAGGLLARHDPAERIERRRPAASSTSPLPGSATTSNTAASASWSTTWTAATASSAGSRRSTSPAGAGAGERQGHRRERPNRPALCDDPQAARVASTSGPIAWSGTGEYPGGCDRLAIAPDGDRSTCRRSRGRTGTCSTRAPATWSTTIVTNSGAHNTIYGPDGRRVYLAGLKSPLLSVADTAHAQGRAGRSARSATSSARSRSTPPRRSVS